MTINPFHARQQRAGIGAAGRRAEKRTAQRVGARQTAASGALDAQKGDFTVKDVLAENKSTQAASMSIKLAWLEKITREALPNGKTPVLSIQFVDEAGNPVKSGAWVMVPEATFAEWLDSKEGP